MFWDLKTIARSCAIKAAVGVGNELRISLAHPHGMEDFNDWILGFRWYSLVFTMARGINLYQHVWFLVRCPRGGHNATPISHEKYAPQNPSRAEKVIQKKNKPKRQVVLCSLGSLMHLYFCWTIPETLNLSEIVLLPSRQSLAHERSHPAIDFANSTIYQAKLLENKAIISGSKRTIRISLIDGSDLPTLIHE